MSERRFDNSPGDGTSTSPRARIWRLRYPILLFLTVNAVFFGAYLWSRGGQSTEVRVIARGSAFEAYVDGKLQSRQRVDEAPPSGGIAISVEHSRKIPSLPRPRGIDSLRVTDVPSGRVLFQDTFSHQLDDRWVLTRGRAVVEDGVLDIQEEGSLFLPAQDWEDVIIDVTFQNVTGATVVARAQGPATGVAYSLRPFRQYDSSLAFLQDGTIAAGFTGGQVFPPTRESLRATLAIVLRPYPTVFLLLLAGLAIVFCAQFADVLWRERRWTLSMTASPFTTAAAVLAIAAFGVTTFLITHYTDRMPHVQDDTSYVFQAKILASGRVAAPAPPVPDVFDIARPPFVVAVDGKWASVYPFGHPAALALGELFNSAWIIPPLLGAATVFLTYAIGRKIYGPATGLGAALLLAASPFFFMTSSSFMSHTTSTFFLLVSIICLLGTGRRTLLYGLGAGISYGLVFNTQSLSAVALVVPLGCYMLARAVRQGERREAALRLAGFVAGGALMFGAYALYNFATRGDPLLTGNSAAGFASSVGFGGAHSVNLGIINEQIQMTFLVLVLNGWPAWIGFLFILALFALATRNVWDYFLLLCAVSLIAAYAFFVGHGLMYGPRYWYPAAPLLMLLTARGVHHAADSIAATAAGIRQRLSATTRDPPLWAARAAVYVMIAALIGSSISSWLLSRHVAWVADFVPARAVELQGFNGADDRLIDVIRGGQLENALVLVNECSNWQCYGTVFWLNTPTLDGDYVIARNIPDRLPDLFRAYPNRRVYVASYTPALVPYGFATDQALGVPLSQFPPAPRASDLRLPSPTPTSTSEYGGSSTERDDRRREDLARVQTALLDYRATHGTYPSTSGSLQSLCRFPADAGCILVEELGSIPLNPPPTGGYFYASSGSTFLLVALLENAVDDGSCPDPLPGDARDAQNPYCIQGE